MSYLAKFLFLLKPLHDKVRKKGSKTSVKPTHTDVKTNLLQHCCTALL